MMDLLKTKQNGFVRLEEFGATATIDSSLIKSKGLIGAKTFYTT